MIKRYAINIAQGSKIEHKNGVYVMHDDYQKLEAQLAEYKDSECRALKSEGRALKQLAVIATLPALWRDISEMKTQDYTDMYGCADELQSILNREKSDG